MEPTDIPTSVVLYRAADLIEKRGWTGGGWNTHLDDAPVCLEGGIAAAMGLNVLNEDGTSTTAVYDTFLSCPAYRAVADYLKHDADMGGFLFVWNDKSDRTAAEVIEVLRAAAVIEEAKEADAALESAHTRFVAALGAEVTA